jgi:anti-anti-sigma regulatory factor
LPVIVFSTGAAQFCRHKASKSWLAWITGEETPTHILARPFLPGRSIKMKITVTKTENPVPVTILYLDGALDGTNFKSSAGLAAFHQIALLFRGKKHPGPDESWPAYRWAVCRHLDRDLDRPPQEHVKLSSPTSDVRDVLNLIGFNSLFEIYSDLPQAVASYRQDVPVMTSIPR